MRADRGWCLITAFAYTAEEEEGRGEAWNLRCSHVLEPPFSCLRNRGRFKMAESTDKTDRLDGLDSLAAISSEAVDLVRKILAVK